nr:TPA_asm: triple gene block protein 1 [Date palm-associated virus A]
MNKFEKRLVDSGFVRTSLPSSSPLVVHAVPGSGKTSLLRKLITEEPTFCCFTCGQPDPPNLSGNYIHKYFQGCYRSDKFCILDEYLLADDISHFDIVLSDPLQCRKHQILGAHYIKRESHRVPRSVCDFLRNLGFEIESSCEGTLSINNFFSEVDLSAVSVCIQKEVFDFCKQQNLICKFPSEVQGLEFEKVNIFVDNSSEELKSTEFYTVATRASKNLNLYLTNESKTTS